MLQTKGRFRTYTGKMVDLLNPEETDICIEDVAHSLSTQCRYLGHPDEFLSVGAHCLNLSRLGEKLYNWDSKLLMIALLHDSVEAYLGDINSLCKGNTYYCLMDPEAEDLVYIKQHTHEQHILARCYRALTPLSDNSAWDAHSRIWDLHEALTHVEMWKIGYSVNLTEEERRILNEQQYFHYNSYNMEGIKEAFLERYHDLISSLKQKRVDDATKRKV